MDSSYFRSSTRSSAVPTAKNRQALLVVLIAGLASIMSPQARAECGWDGLALEGNSKNRTILLDVAGIRMLAARFWFEDPKNPYPLETRMGMHDTAVAGRSCINWPLPDLANEFAAVVYTPPLSATRSPSGLGFRVPSSNPAVSFDMEFPGATQHQSGGLLLGTSRIRVSSTGNLQPAWSLPSFSLRVSVVKTAHFTADLSKALILDTDGLGALTYFSASEPSKKAAYDQKLQFPSFYWEGSSSPKPNQLLGRALAPYCEFTPGGLGFSTVTLSPVSTSAFSGIGPAAHPAASEKIYFRCFGLADLQPKIYFDATYPLGNGSEGVGMEAATSDVGVQITFDGKPAALGSLNRLPISVNLVNIPNVVHAQFPLVPGFYDVKGRVCLPDSNCTADMTQPNWINIQPKQVSTTAEVQFNYYQTTVQTPLAGAVRVPFSVTVDVQ